MEKKAEDFSSFSYFQENNYKKHRAPIEIGYTTKAENQPYSDKTTILKEIKPKKSYVQISSSGMLKTHCDLFPYSEDKDSKAVHSSTFFSRRGHNLEGIELFQNDKRINFALYELNKLNGIAEVGYNYIKFYNGDKYLFENSERSFTNSLGTYIKYNRDARSTSNHFYWKRFFNESLINDIDSVYYKNEVKHKMTADSLKGGSRSVLKFSSGSEYQYLV